MYKVTPFFEINAGGTKRIVSSSDWAFAQRFAAVAGNDHVACIKFLRTTLKCDLITGKFLLKAALEEQARS